MFNKIFSYLFTIALFTFCLSSCGGESTTTGGNQSGDTEYKQDGKFIQYTLGEPKSLNPYNRTTAFGGLLVERAFQSLITMDWFSSEIVPMLATSRPEIKTRDDGKVEMTLEMRPEAKWDNGTPITPEDVAFSLKVMKNPTVDNAHLRLYFEYIEDVVIDAENPMKFTLVCKEPYMLMESALIDLMIIPSYVYDVDGIMKKYTVKQMANTPMAKMEKDDNLIRFGKEFNSTKFSREVVSGSGPYKFDRWETNQRLIYKLKKDWYGHKLKKEHHWFDANMDEIVYEVINDATTATVALKGGKIDAMNRINPRIFVKEMREDEDFNSRFHTGTPTQFLYSYFGMNLRHPKFEDVKTRKALRLLMDANEYGNTIFYGLAERVTSFIHPSKKEFINADLEVYQQDIEAAKKLLAEAGWTDSNGNGTLDKNIDGKVTEFVIDFIFPNGAKTSEQGVLMYKESCKKAGIQIEPRSIDFSVMQGDLKAHKFEMYYGIWGSSPLESDPKQIWHTSSANGGSNYVSFGTPRSDELIDNLRRELDKPKRIAIYNELQKIIDDECPYIFINATQNRIAVSKKFDNVNFTGMVPGYYIPSLQEVMVMED